MLSTRRFGARGACRLVDMGPASATANSASSASMAAHPQYHARQQVRTNYSSLIDPGSAASGGAGGGAGVRHSRSGGGRSLSPVGLRTPARTCTWSTPFKSGSRYKWLKFGRSWLISFQILGTSFVTDSIRCLKSPPRMFSATKAVPNASGM